MSDVVVQYPLLSCLASFTFGMFAGAWSYRKRLQQGPMTLPMISYDAAMAALARMDDPSCGDPNRLIVATYLRTHAPDDGGAI